ncbi:MAG: YfhO family protein [Clostridiaceae bacterium]|nr:YfhO family protein [Clostridiaceae bacterium]
MDRRTDGRVLTGLVLIVTLFLVLLERRYPYFFLQDDNRDQYLPYFVHNARALLHGEIALYNFHQYLGLPHLANGNAGALYPLSWLSVLVSRLFWGHDFAAIDLVVCFHLVLGSAGFFLMLRAMGLGRPASAFGAITWPLTSYFLYISNSWYVVSGPVAAMPWMIFFAIQLHQGERPGCSLAALVVARLLLIFIGHPQFFLYAVIFEALLILLLVPGGHNLFRPSRARLWYWASFAMTAIFSLPLVLPMWQQTRQSIRSGPIDYDTFVSGSTILPLWLKGLTDPYEGHVFQSISFVGLACLAFCLVAIFFFLLAIIRRKSMPVQRRRLLAVLFVLGAFSFLWAGSILVPRIIYLVPILNRFRWPYKLLIQFSLFLIAFSSCGLDLFLDALSQARFLRGRRLILDIAACCLIVIQLIQFGFLYYAHPVRALRIHRETVPWSEPLKDQLSDGRILSVGFDYTSEYTAHTLAFNYSTFWGLHHYAGYDALLPAANDRATPGTGAYSGYFDDLGNNRTTLADRLEALRGWGVRWYVVNPEYVRRYGELPLVRIAEDADRIVYRDDAALPLAYWVNTQEDPGIALSHTANALVLQTNRTHAESLIVNCLWNRYFKASLDGEPIPLAVQDDRPMIFVPEGQHTIRITYRDPYFSAGCRIAWSFLLLLALFGLLRHHKARSKHALAAARPAKAD